MKDQALPSLVVLISGSGSNLQAIIDAVARGKIPARIASVISNRADAGGLERARRAGIATTVIEHRNYPTRSAFDQALIEHIDRHRPELVILAGFMRILGEAFIRHYADRLLNIHPSLLPEFKGLNTHQRVLEAGRTEHGATVHLVSAELDSGAPVIQARIDIENGETPAELAQRVLKQEHHIYPLAIQLFIEGQLRARNGRLYYRQQPLNQPLIWKDQQLLE